MPYTCTMWSTRYGRCVRTHITAHCNNVAPQKFSLDLPSSTLATPSGFLTEKSLSWKMNGKSGERKNYVNYASMHTPIHVLRCSLHTRLRNECFVLLCVCIIYHSNWFSQTKRVYTHKENICCELHRSHRSHQKCRVISVFRTCMCLWVCFADGEIFASTSDSTNEILHPCNKNLTNARLPFGRRFYSWIIEVCTNCKTLNGDGSKRWTRLQCISIQLFLSTRRL